MITIIKPFRPLNIKGPCISLVFGVVDSIKLKQHLYGEQSITYIYCRYD